MKAGKKNLAMMDLLILTKREGTIDDDGIKEEVDTFTFEVIGLNVVEFLDI